MVVQRSCEVGREEGGLGSLVREKGKGNVKTNNSKSQSVELTSDRPGVFKCRDQEKIGSKIETEEHTYRHAQVGRHSHSPVSVE